MAQQPPRAVNRFLLYVSDGTGIVCVKAPSTADAIAAVQPREVTGISWQEPATGFWLACDHLLERNQQ